MNNSNSQEPPIAEEANAEVSSNKAPTKKGKSESAEAIKDQGDTKKEAPEKGETKTEGMDTDKTNAGAKAKTGLVGTRANFEAIGSEFR